MLCVHISCIPIRFTISRCGRLSKTRARGIDTFVAVHAGEPRLSWLVSWQAWATVCARALLNNCKSGKPWRFDDRWLEERVQDRVRGGRSSCSPARCVVRLVQGPAVPVQAFKELKKGTAAGNAVTTAVKILEVDTSIFVLEC